MSKTNVVIEAIFDTVTIMVSDAFKISVRTKSTILLFVNNFQRK